MRVQDNDRAFRPIQSLMTFANFRIAGPVYVSIGVQVNQKLFDGPLLGGTYRVPLGNGHGLNVTAGVQFSREIGIDPASGFADGQLLDPAAGLTVDDVPTRSTWHGRAALGLTLDF